MDQSKIQEKIRYIQIETGTSCNYKCIYCPVSYYPKKGSFMSLELVEKISKSLAYFPNIKQIYLNGFDEPTLNPNLVTIIEKLAYLPAKITLLTNGTNLTSELVNKIVNIGTRIEFDIHLSAVNRQDYQRIHRSKQFTKVMKNIQYLETLDQVEIHISMLGFDTDRDNRIFEEIKTHFKNTSFKIHKWLPNDRAGALKNEFNLDIYNESLRGCSLEDRTRQWIHINATGKVILCCQDYFEEYVIGDLHHQSLFDIVNSEKLQKYNDWTTGIIEAPKNFICRYCTFAITDNNNIKHFKL